MIHHYNYSSPLSHFLGQYPGGISEEGTPVSENTSPVQETMTTKYPGVGTPGSSIATVGQGKSFTIAAILGLKPDQVDIQAAPTDLTVVNLSVHQGVTERLSDCRNRLQLPVARHGSTSAPGSVYQRQHGLSGPYHKGQGPGAHKKGLGGSSGSKSKRVRTIFTPEQLERLEAEFERQQYMVGPERLYLAHTLQLTEAQVKVWFQNRRIKWRKHHLEVTQQRLAAIKQRQLLAAAASGAGDVPDTADGEDSGSESDT